MCECVNLMDHFGDKYRISWDEAYNFRNVTRDCLDLWYARLRGKYGEVHPHSYELLAVETENHPGIKKRLELCGCTTTYLDGDFGFGSFLFKPEHLGEIAEIVRLYRRPRISEARREELSRNMKSVWSHIQENRESSDSQTHSDALA
jgi:hypothetical protein